jgi:hypothetical protein
MVMVMVMAMIMVMVMAMDTRSMHIQDFTKGVLLIIHEDTFFQLKFNQA